MHRLTPSLVVAALAALLLSACDDDPTGPENELSITTTSLAPATVGESYTEGVDATGGEGSYTWSVVAGTLPPGLVLETEDVGEDPEDDLLITGTVNTQGTSTFTVEVRSEDGQTARREFTIEVNRQLVRNAALPPALAGAPYDVSLRATGGNGTYSWQLVEGQLPPGLQLSGSRITGTPTGTDTATVTFEVTSGGESARKTFEIRVVAHRTDRYDITPMYVSDVPAGIQPHLDAAIAQWEAALTGDLAPVSLEGLASGSCGGFSQEAAGTVTDDILILVNIDSIDGPGEILGQAGPCFIRNSDSLPLLGILTLDSEDLEPLVGRETLTDLLAHEIGHVLGFGSLWDFFGLTRYPGTDSTQFVGERAVAEYEALGGSGPVPLEESGGEGTIDSHWDEETFNTELMTGFIESGGTQNPLSRVSIGSFADLGYTVDLGAAEPYALPLLGLLRADGAAGHEVPRLGRDILLDEPIIVVDDAGTPVRILRPMGGTP